MTAPVAVYGATGYTGRLVAAELARRGVPAVLSGRSAEKLEAVAAGLGPSAQVQVRPAAAGDDAALRGAFAEAAVVVNCAGPFVHSGEQVVAAAIAAGCHYVDTTGEQPFMRAVLDGHDAAARAAGVAVVPGLGFDYLPGDLLCALVAHGAGPLRELVVAYAVEEFGMTRGTMRSAVEMLKPGDVVWEDGRWVEPGPVRPFRAAFTFPGPLGRQTMGRYPSGEQVTVPRHVDVRRVVSLLTASTTAPQAPGLLPFVVPGVSVALRSSRLRAGLMKAIGRLPEGPDEEARRSARFTICVVAEGEDGRRHEGELHGRDIYGLTAETTVRAARWMAADGYDRAGALAPAQAFDPVRFLDALGPAGITYAVEVPAPARR